MFLYIKRELSLLVVVVVVVVVVVSLELGIFQGRPKSIRPNSETVKIRPMAQEADSTHFRSPTWPQVLVLINT